MLSPTYLQHYYNKTCNSISPLTLSPTQLQHFYNKTCNNISPLTLSPTQLQHYYNKTLSHHHLHYSPPPVSRCLTNASRGNLFNVWGFRNEAVGSDNAQLIGGACLQVCDVLPLGDHFIRRAQPLCRIWSTQQTNHQNLVNRTLSCLAKQIRANQGFRTRMVDLNRVPTHQTTWKIRTF